MLYSEKVMDHFRNPRNVGEIENADGVGQVGNAKCGDIMRMTLKIDDGVITDAKFTTFGCGSAIATSSIATEMIKGKPVSEALELSNKAVVEALDGRQAVEAFAQSAPGSFDVVLMDVMMPVMDGLEAPRRIRNGENPLGRIIPILAMTANAFLEDMQKSKEAGMDVHLSKPVDIAALEQTVKHFRVTPPH